MHSPAARRPPKYMTPRPPRDRSEGSNSPCGSGRRQPSDLDLHTTPQESATTMSSSWSTGDLARYETMEKALERCKAQLARAAEENEFLKRTLFHNFVRGCEVEAESAEFLNSEIQSQITPLDQSIVDLCYDSEPITLADDFDELPTKPHIQEVRPYLDSLLCSTIDMDKILEYKMDTVMNFTEAHLPWLNTMVGRIARDEGIDGISNLVSYVKRVIAYAQPSGLARPAFFMLRANFLCDVARRDHKRCGRTFTTSTAILPVSFIHGTCGRCSTPSTTCGAYNQDR